VEAAERPAAQLCRRYSSGNALKQLPPAKTGPIVRDAQPRPLERLVGWLSDALFQECVQPKHTRTGIHSTAARLSPALITPHPCMRRLAAAPAALAGNACIQPTPARADVLLCLACREHASNLRLHGTAFCGTHDALAVGTGTPGDRTVHCAGTAQQPPNGLPISCAAPIDRYECSHKITFQKCSDLVDAKRRQLERFVRRRASYLHQSFQAKPDFERYDLLVLADTITVAVRSGVGLSLRAL
jgi:hypothetical protein